MEKIAIIILNYNSWNDTLDEIELCHKKLGIFYDNIIVVDNASSNESAEKLQKASVGKFIFLESDDNNGYAAGNNIGLRYAFQNGYDYAWILNNDILLEDKNTLKKLIEVFHKDENIAVVNPDIYAPDGHLFNRDAIRPSTWDYTFGLFSYKRRGRNIVDLGGYSIIYRPQGCCMLVDLKKMNEIDYMDENTFLYVEESILAERLKRYGYKCACCPQTKVVHNHSKTVKSSLAKRKVIKINNESFAYYLGEYRKFNRLEIYLCCFFNYFKLLVLDK